MVFSRDNHKCRMCGKPSSEVKLEVDHIYPYGEGGTDDIDNLASLCKNCNVGKSDLFLRSILKEKVERGDFYPVELPILNVSFKTLNYGEGKIHQYQLLIEVENETSRSVVNPQIEVVLPMEAVLKISSGGQMSNEGIYTKVFFAKLDTQVIHPKKKETLMETPNVLLHYKMDSDMSDNQRIMNAEFTITLLGNDMLPVYEKRKFSKMQEF